MPIWTNKDGLKVLSGLDTTKVVPGGMTVDSVERTLKITFDTANLGNLTTAGNTDGREPAIPARAYITKAWFVPEVAFTSGGATTLDIGLAQADGTAIDADGIDAAIAKTAIDAIGEAVVCDGALVGGTAGIGANAGYVYFTVGTGPYTAGKGILYINYIVQQG